MPLAVGLYAWPLKAPFAIARGVKTEAVTVVAHVSDGTHVGKGEATPYPRYGETPEDVQADAFSLRETIPSADGPAADRARLNELARTMAARNALDCALWDLEAKQRGATVAALAGLTPPAAAVTAVTVGLDAPEAMAAAAKTANAPLLKLKLGKGDASDETARLRAVHAAAPTSRLIVDANEGWSIETLRALDPIMAEIGVGFVEQPLPADADAVLAELELQTKLCADESCHTVEDLPQLAGRYQVVNIKLDKTGGLTGAIALRAAAQAAGFEIMIGCMVASSLAMAPAFMLSDGAAAVDLDGPLWLRFDCLDPITFDGARMLAPQAALWG